MATARKAIDELLKEDRPLLMPGIYDALSAKLAERAGFAAAFVSGYSLSATLLGEPDFGLLSQTQVIDAADRICSATDMPVLIDIDTGYGNAFNVERTVESLLRAGAAGCFLEDQVWPKRCGHMENKRVIPLEEYLPKLRAALKTAEGTGFFVTARTDARAAVDLDEAIHRAKAFADVGANAVFVEAPQSIEELEQVREALPRSVPLVANMVEKGKTPLRTVDELYGMGYQIVVSPVCGVLSQARALEKTYGALKRDGITTAAQPEMFSFDDFNRLVGLHERYEREKEWL